MNVWEAITGNSELPVQAGNTFFDHIMNPNSAGITIIRSSSDIIGTIDSNIVEFGSDTQTVTSQNNQGAITRQSGNRSLTAKGEGRTLSVTTTGKRGTFTNGTRKVIIK